MRVLKWIIATVLVVAVGIGVSASLWAAPRAARLTLRVACPTVFIEGRSVEYAVDKLRNLGLLPVDITQFVSIEVDAGARRMDAIVFGVLDYRAVYYPGEGCVLQD